MTSPERQFVKTATNPLNPKHRADMDPRDPGLGIHKALTVVVAVDAETVKEFALTVRTWFRFARPLFDHPWIIIYDESQLDGMPDILRAIHAHTCDDNRRESENLCHALLEALDAAIPWPFPNHPEWGKKYGPGEHPDPPVYENQREKMLSAFCYVASYVRTSHWMKLDSDVTRGPEHLGVPLYQPEWITGDPERGTKPKDVVASPWGYTKPAHQMYDVYRWAKNIELSQQIDNPGFAWPHAPKLYLPVSPEASTVRHQRFASWVSIYSKIFTLEAMTTAWRFAGPCKIPIPSQDGYHYYMAELLGAKVERFRFKNLGYKHWVSQKKLKAYCRELNLI